MAPALCCTRRFLRPRSSVRSPPGCISHSNPALASSDVLPFPEEVANTGRPAYPPLEARGIGRPTPVQPLLDGLPAEAIAVFLLCPEPKVRHSLSHEGVDVILAAVRPCCQFPSAWKSGHSACSSASCAPGGGLSDRTLRAVPKGRPAAPTRPAGRSKPEPDRTSQTGPGPEESRGWTGWALPPPASRSCSACPCHARTPSPLLPPAALEPGPCPLRLGGQSYATAAASSAAISAHSHSRCGS